MIEANLDESGIHQDAAVCVIAGYFAGPGQWRKFEQAWRKVLAQFSVPMEKFHATELIAKRRFFFDWTRDQLNEFLNAVANTIAEHQKIHPVSTGLIIADFNSFSERQRRFFTGATLTPAGALTGGSPNKPYFAPFQHCIRKIACYAAVGGKANFAFGLDRPFASYARELFKVIKENPIQINCKERLGEARYPLASETPQLQAADLLAFLTYQHMLERLADGRWGEIQPSTLLTACLTNRISMEDFEFLNQTHLQNILEQTYAISGRRWDTP